MSAGPQDPDPDLDGQRPRRPQDRDPTQRRPRETRPDGPPPQGPSARAGHIRAILLIAGVFVAAGLLALLVYAILGEEFSFDGGGGALIYLIALLALISSGLLVGREIGFKPAIKAAIFWVGLGLLLILLYSFRADLTAVWDRIAGELDPSRGISEGNTVRFTAETDGHFYVAGTANGQPVRFMIDTGASSTVLSRGDAARIGVPVDRLSYSYRVETANGTVEAAPARLQSLEIAGRQLQNEWVIVLRNEQDLSVIGLSTLSKFQSYEVRGNTLTLRW